MKKHNKIPLSTIIKHNWFILKTALQEAPFYTIHLLTSQIIHQIIIFIEHIYMIAFVVDCIQYQKPFFHAAVFIISVFVGLRLIGMVGTIYAVNFRPKGIEKINRRLRLELYNKAINIDLACYDDPQFYTDFVWAMSDISTRVEKILQSSANLLGAIAGIFISGVYILSNDPIGIIFVIFSFAITFIFALKLNKSKFQMEILLKPYIRKRDYINRVFYLSDYAKEIRTGDIKEKLYEDFTAANDTIQSIIQKETKKMVWYQFIIDYISNSLIFFGGYFIYLLYIVIVKNLLSYGTIVALFSTTNSLKECMQNFAIVIPEFQQHSMYINKVSLFLNYDIKITNKENANPVSNLAEDIELKNVFFRYNEKQDYILKNINLTIKKGQKIAFVGYNGAGKTTLIKLIMRLYDASSGTITCGKKAITDFDVNDYRKQFGTVFQDYQLFAASLKENVSMDNTNCENQEIISSLEDSGFSERLSTLAHGLETPLTKEFDEEGINFSGGESQKIAISRILYKKCPYIILDEPSSALDPIAEYNLNNTMLNLSTDKTIIFISHRLSTTMMADCIYMFENGEIVECGNHIDLIKQNGKYAQMFKLQSEKYR